MDPLSRAEHFRKMAVRYEELAKLCPLPVLNNFYRSYAARYILMEREARMRVLENNFGWNPIDTVPPNEDVMLEVTDGHGKPYRLNKPCRLTASGWVSSNGTPLIVTPVKWRPYRGGTAR
jgi:hypothetical protein